MQLELGRLIQREEQEAAQGLGRGMVPCKAPLGWKLPGCFISSVYFTNTPKLPEERELLVTNSFVRNPIFLQKRSDGNFIVTCILGLTSPLFAHTDVIYFAPCMV